MLFSCVIANADTGCYVSSIKKVYVAPVYSSNLYAGSRYGDYENCTAGGSPSYSYYVINSTGASCKAEYDGSGSNTSSSNYTYNGVVVNFSVYNCDLDKGQLLLLSLLGVIGFFKIRKKFFAERFSYLS